MQQWHQIEFLVNSADFDIIEDYLFEHNAGSITRIDNKENTKITVLYENECDIQTIVVNINNLFMDKIIGCIHYEIIKDQQWEAAWLYDYEPVEIGKNIVVYPDWKEAPKNNDKTYVLVDPSIAFGCGNHETTKMCLEWLESNVNADSKVLDYGCGTGILAIAAIKLGAKYAEGIDIDLNSIESSIKNAKTNGVTQQTLFAVEATDNMYDLLVANIFSNVLISLVDTMLAKLKFGGKIALSGIIENQVKEVSEVFEKHGVIFDKPRQLGQWFMLDGVKSGL